MSSLAFLFFELCGKGQHVGVHVRLDPVIRLDDGDPRAGCLSYAAVASCAVALILLIDNFDARVVAGKAVDGRQRVIGAPSLSRIISRFLYVCPTMLLRHCFAYNER